MALYSPPWTVRSAWRSPSKLSLRKATRPSTGCLKIPVVTFSHAMSFLAGARCSPRPTSSGLVLSVGVGFESAGQLPVPPCSPHARAKHPVLDERLAKTIHVPGNRNLRDQIQVTVSNKSAHKAEICNHGFVRDRAWLN